MRRTIKKFATALLVGALAISFIFLGLWQLHRAQDLKSASESPIQAITKPVPLNSVATSTGSIPASSVGKTVTASGHYIANFKAPRQIDGADQIHDWDVALLQVETDSAILVVRGLWGERTASPEIVMSTLVTVTGTLMPHQNTDRAINTPSQLSRLDSSVLTGVTDMQLYDGFIIAKSESSRYGVEERSRIVPPKLTSGVPGYYWQHISYVVIWWLMALLILWLPFYRGPKTIESEYEHSA